MTGFTVSEAFDAFFARPEAEQEDILIGLQDLGVLPELAWKFYQLLP